MSDPKPRISVVSAWYNRADYIKASVDSILDQDFEDFEYIVVNDGSPDPEVARILKGYNDPRLRVIEQENTGFTRAIDRGVRSAQAEMIALQDAGDISLPGRLRKQYDYMQANPDCVVVGCKISNAFAEAGHVGEDEVRPVDNLHPTMDDLKRSNPFTHGEVMYRKSVYEKIGGYRPFFHFAQDRDLWMRMAPEGKLHVIDDHLYRRVKFVEDSVSTNRSKLVLQKLLSEFAIQCHDWRETQGFDPIDRYGPAGGMFALPSKPASQFIAVQAMRELKQGDRTEAERMLRISFGQGVNYSNIRALFMFYTGL